jgi:hypothetical protein
MFAGWEGGGSGMNPEREAHRDKMERLESHSKELFDLVSISIRLTGFSCMPEWWQERARRVVAVIDGREVER